MSFDTLTGKLWQLAKASPLGGTRTLPDLFKPANGFIVAVEATQHNFGREGLQRVLRHAIDNDLLVGWWENEDGILQFDACFQLHNRQEAIDRGRSEKQRAIFDLNTMTEIRI